MAIVLLPCAIRSCHRSSNCTKLLLGLLLAYSSRFCNLIALLWASNHPKDAAGIGTEEDLILISLTSAKITITSPDVMWGFINVLFFASSVRAYEGIIANLTN